MDLLAKRLHATEARNILLIFIGLVFCGFVEGYLCRMNLIAIFLTLTALLTTKTSGKWDNADALFGFDISRVFQLGKKVSS